METDPRNPQPPAHRAPSPEGATRYLDLDHDGRLSGPEVALWIAVLVVGVGGLLYLLTSGTVTVDQLVALVSGLLTGAGGLQAGRALRQRVGGGR
jgi:hypothetical protein